VTNGGAPAAATAAAAAAAVASADADDVCVVGWPVCPVIGGEVGVKLPGVLLGVGEDCCFNRFILWWRRHFARLLENQT